MHKGCVSSSELKLQGFIPSNDKQAFITMIVGRSDSYQLGASRSMLVKLARDISVRELTDRTGYFCSQIALPSLVSPGVLHSAVGLWSGLSEPALARRCVERTFGTRRQRRRGAPTKED